MAGWENIARYNGISTSLAGLIVVFSVLTLISLFIAWLPKILELLPADTADSEPASSTASPSENASIAAAIGYAMYLDQRQGD